MTVGHKIGEIREKCHQYKTQRSKAGPRDANFSQWSQSGFFRMVYKYSYVACNISEWFAKLTKYAGGKLGAKSGNLGAKIVKKCIVVAGMYLNTKLKTKIKLSKRSIKNGYNTSI